jgi:hypothetical protein
VRIVCLFLNRKVSTLRPVKKKPDMDTHQNVRNPGYEKFLRQLLTPLMKFVQDGASSLDYGCGPGPVLVEIMKEEGFKASGYDPFYSPIDLRSYDFVTCTEVVEHFNHPKQEWEKLLSISRIFGIMTKLYDDEDLETWYYHKDPTHVSFYHSETIKFIAMEYNLEILEMNSIIQILRKKDPTLSLV